MPTTNTVKLSPIKVQVRVVSEGDLHSISINFVGQCSKILVLALFRLAGINYI